MFLNLEPQTYLGIDPSLTGTGVVVLDVSGEVLHERVYSSPAHLTDTKRVSELLHNIFHDVHDYISAPCLAAVEAYSMGSRFQGKMFARAELSGLIRYTIRSQYERPHLFIPPSVLSSFLGIPPKTKSEQKKRLTAQVANERYDYRNADYNIVDAFVLAKIAEAFCGQMLKLGKMQLELPR